MVSPKITPCCQDKEGWQNIGFTRGDTAGYKFQRTDINGDVITTIADRLYFTVKSQFEDKNYQFQKKLEDFTFDEDGWYHFVINPEDTNNLKFTKYVYDIEAIQGGVKSTPLKGFFLMDPESTWQANEGGNNG